MNSIIYQKLIRIADVLDNAKLYNCANRIDNLIKKIASSPYGWWIEPDGKEHEVGFQEHLRFLRTNKHLVDPFEDKEITSYNNAFAKGWIRVISERPQVVFVVPDSSTTYLITCQGFAKKHGFRSVIYDTRSTSLDYRTPIPIKHFLSADSVSWLRELSKHMANANL